MDIPVFICGRGTTLLESYHLHLNRFIPGSSANDFNIQAYLLDGIIRWNTKLGLNNVQSSSSCQLNFHSFDGKLQQIANSLSQGVFGSKLTPLHQPPSKYTGEAIGVQYLYNQSGLTLCTDPLQLHNKIDEGVDEVKLDPGHEDGMEEERQVELNDVAVRSDDSSDDDKEDSEEVNSHYNCP